MTQKGQHSHFNVKFLKGYGFSVSVKDNKLVLKNNYDPFKESESEEWFINNLPYEKIVLSGKGYISTEALALLNQHNRNLILVDTYGKPISMINGVMESNTATKNRMAQYDAFRDTEKRKYLSKQIVKAKLESQIRFLKSVERTDLNLGIETLEANLRQVSTRSELGLEAGSGRAYFIEYSKLIPKKHGFVSRNQSHIRTSKSGASDVINGLLNYGYSVLAGEISKYINGMGLDAYYGFYHKEQISFQPLVYDLIEPFRWLVDYSAYRLANETNKEHRIYKKDYAFTKEGLVVLDYNLIRRFLQLLERTFQKERRYAFKHGAKTKDGLKSCHEITIAKIAVQNLVEFCIGKQKEFRI